ncbi:MAG: hypothetical protein HY320_09710 [Armatimonadetes bacterium]|nr:hypothetical protein [Armatimonadota bacterium]
MQYPLHFRSGPLVVLVLAALGWLAGLPRAEAQRTDPRGLRQQGRVPAGGRGYRNYGYGFRGWDPTRPTVIIEPPPLLSPNSFGLIEEGFIFLRNTSPDPERFLGGRWNPRVTVINPLPTVTVFPPLYGFPGFAGYGGYLPPYLPPERVYVERLVIIRNGKEGGPPQSAGNGYAAPSPSPSQPADHQGAVPEGDGFYLSPAMSADTLPAALDDIRRSWLNGDFEHFKTRVRSDGKVRIYPAGKYAYSIAAEDFLQVAREAMVKIDTIGFEFDAPQQTEGARVLVTGKHIFIDAEKQKQEVYISYALERGKDGRWRITGAGSSNRPITAHQEQ